MSGRRRGKRQGWEREKQGWEKEKKKERERQGWERKIERERTISRETEVGETQREREPLRKRGMVGERKIGIERERETGVRER